MWNGQDNQSTVEIFEHYKFNYSYGPYIHISRNKMLWLTQPFPFENASILKVLSSILFDEPSILCRTMYFYGCGNHSFFSVQALQPSEKISKRRDGRVFQFHAVIHRIVGLRM